MKKGTLLLLVFMWIAACSYAQATFAPYVNYPISAGYADHLTAGDFNHDGKTDIAVAISWDLHAVLVYYQNPITGAMDTPAVQYNYPLYSAGVRAITSGDIDNNGRDDIIIAYGDSIGVYYQDTSSSLKPLISIWCSEGEVAVIKVADVDMDGFNDIVAVPFNSSSDVIVYCGREGSGFTQINYPTPYTGSYLDDLRVGKVGRDTINSLVRMNGEFTVIITQLRIRKDRVLDTTIFRNIPVGAGPAMSGVEIGRFTDTTVNQIAATYGGNMPSAHLAIWTLPILHTTPIQLLPFQTFLNRSLPDISAIRSQNNWSSFTGDGVKSA